MSTSVGNTVVAGTLNTYQPNGLGLVATRSFLGPTGPAICPRIDPHGIANGRAVGPRAFHWHGFPARWAGLGKLLGLWPVASFDLCINDSL